VIRLAEEWVLVAWLIVTTAALRAVGPVALGGRDLPPRAMGVVTLLAPALLAALVVTQTFGGTGSELVLDERAVGVAGAGVVLALRGGILLAITVAVALSALAHAVL
jgi:Branched-chain amino acid transport protein (AzlD)